MSQLYDTLKIFDVGMAKIYMDDTGDRPGAKVKKATAEKLFNYAIKDKKIQRVEASAFLQLFLDAKFEKDAKEWLLVNLKAEVDRIETYKPNKFLSSKIAKALSSVVTSRIQFVGKYTNIAYNPVQYATVGRLIDQGHVEVAAAPSGSSGLLSYLDEGSASYYSTTDKLMVPDMFIEDVPDFDVPLFYYLVVHEATHVIQDWLDLDKLFHWHTETDAYIAQAVAMIALKVPSEESAKHPATVALKEIGKLLDKQKPLMGKPFDAAYDLVLDAVSKFHLYKAKKDLPFAKVSTDKVHINPRTKRPESEKEIFERLYQEALKS